MTADKAGAFPHVLDVGRADVVSEGGDDFPQDLTGGRAAGLRLRRPIRADGVVPLEIFGDAVPDRDVRI